MKNEIIMHKRQKEKISQLKIDLAESKERILSLEQRLQSECDLKVANYVDQLEKVKKQYDEKVKKKCNTYNLCIIIYLFYYNITQIVLHTTFRLKN